MMENEHVTMEELSGTIEAGQPLNTMQRRRFLQAALAAGVGAAVGPALLPSAAQAQASGTDTILLTVTLMGGNDGLNTLCLLYTSPSPRDATLSRMPSSA